MARITKAQYFQTIGYKPHPRQWLYHNSTARFRVPVCGRRFGKSTMAGKDLEPEMFEDKRRFWIVGPTYDLGEKEFRVIWDDLILGAGFGKIKAVKKAYNKKQGDMYIQLPNQTRVEVRSADHPENLVGESLHGVIMSEAAKHREETFDKYIRPALGDHRGWATFPTTPEGQNWLHRMWQYGQNPDFPDYASWRFPSWDNPVLYPGGENDPEILLIKQTTPDPAWFEQEIAADFTAFTGKIYRDFQESTHVTSVKYRPDLPNYIAFDFGFNAPFAAIEFQVDPWDNILIWREHYREQLMLEDHIKVMQQREQPPGYKIDLGFGDAEDPEGCLYLTRHFCPTIWDPLAKTNWRQGVELVMRFLKMRHVGEADEFGTPLEKPGLLVDYSCVNLIREFNNYKGVPGTTGRNPRSPRDLPQKIDDHALDALRYGLMHLYELGANRHLDEVMSYRDLVDANRRAGVGDGGYFTAGIIL